MGQGVKVFAAKPEQLGSVTHPVEGENQLH